MGLGAGGRGAGTWSWSWAGREGAGSTAGRSSWGGCWEEEVTGSDSEQVKKKDIEEED